MLTFHYLTLNEKLGKYELSPALKKTDWNMQAKPYYIFTAHTGIYTASVLDVWKW